MQSPDRLDIVPEHVADPVRRAPWRTRLLTGCGDGLLSLALNGAVVGWLVLTGWPLWPMPVPQAISVDLVDHVPEPKGSGPGSAEKESEASSKSETAMAGDAAPPSRDQPPRPAPDAPPAHRPEPGPQHEPMPEPRPEPETPQRPKPEAPQRPAEPAVPADGPEPSQAAQPADAPPSSQAATPPPPEHPDNAPAPRLVEAPSAPPPATPQDSTEVRPEATPPADVAAGTPTELPARRPVLAAPEDADAVPPPSPPPEAPPLTAEQRRQAETTAKLAAVLPFGASIGSDPLQALSGSGGQGASTAYRGQVYANFNKADDIIAEAKAKHLKGQAVVAFTLDDGGGLAHLAIAVSSGNPDVDRAALELIRRGAPYPPPPPGAQRSFSPAIGLGLDD